MARACVDRSQSFVPSISTLEKVQLLRPDHPAMLHLTDHDAGRDAD
jgi:hypothetical protein